MLNKNVSIPTDLVLSELQTLKYAQDLTHIYISERSKREKLEVAYQTLDAVFSSTPEGLVVLDDAFMIRQTNDAFNRMVETSSQVQVLGKPIVEVLLCAELLPALHALIDHGLTSVEVELLITQPVKRVLMISITRLQSGHLHGWVMSIHDRSKLKRMEHQKAEFINLAAHELRTPLTAILGYSEILLSDAPNGLDPCYVEYLNAIVQGGRRLSKINTEITQFAELNEGDVQDHSITQFALSDLIAEVLSELKQQATERDIELRFVSPAPEIQMRADAALLRQALYQLILNGIMFNHSSGYVQIVSASSSNRIGIQVIDSGVGISQTDVDAIFDPFFQVEEHDVRVVGGLGLGLSIARHAIRQLDGVIFVTSTLGKGTIFSLDLPAQQSDTQSDAAALKTQLEASAQQTLAYAQDLQKLYRQLQQANHQLQNVNLQLEEANRLKSNFMSVVTHELRSPFVSIDFALQAFPRYGIAHLHPDQRELLEQVTRSFKEARELINHLISFAELLNKQGRLNLQVVDVGRLFDEAVIVLRPMAEQRGLTLRVEIPPSLMLPAGDKERISEAVWHLIQNALKFTPANGRIVVRAYAKNGRVVIEVQDSGIGIPLEKQAQVWESFAQLADSLKRGMEGLGLGLALVRYVAVAHGGDVIMQSERGVGSTIGFWLPDRID